MIAQAQFSIEIVEGCRLGRLDVPYPKIADCINFLVAPRQQACIVSASQRRSSVSLYFQGSDTLYAHLERHFNAQRHPHPDSLVGAALQ